MSKRIGLVLVIFLAALASCTSRNDIHQVAFDGNIDKVKAYIEAGGKLDTLDEGGNSLMRNAAAGGHVDLMKYLESKGADVKELKNARGLIHAAVESKNIEAVKFLLDRGINIDDKNPDEILSSNETPLLIAAKNRNYDMMSYLISKGANVNAKNKQGDTPLIETIFLSFTEGSPLKCVMLLVQKGADVNLADNKGSTPVALASLTEQKDVVEYLVQKGADINRRGEEGETALTYAAGKANKQLFEYFVKLGANPNVKLDDSTTVLMRAADSNKIEFVQSLLSKYKYKIGDKDTLGRNLLMHAVEKSDGQMIDYIVSKLHADVNCKDYHGTTSLMLAAGSFQLEKAKVLIKYGSRINAQDSDGFTPLMYSARSSFYDDSVPREEDFRDFMKYLIDSGARKDIRNKAGLVALDYVKDKQLPTIIELLK